jgi:hypothetical protein
VDGITGREDQKRDEKAPICCDMHGRNCEPPSELCCRDCSEAAHDTFPIRHADGSVCSAPGAAQGGFERMLADPYEQFDQRGELLKSVIEYANAEPAAASGQASSRDHLTAVVLSVADIERIKEAAYRAGREDLLRSGSCPECTAGDPHNEPDVPHIHLTPYGYLLYAADHERPGFIEEIRAAERRAGREDAAQDLNEPRSDSRDAIGGTAMRHAYRNASEIARGPGVQPTEEQRAREEDQKRDEEQR